MKRCFLVFSSLAGVVSIGLLNGLIGRKTALLTKTRHGYPLQRNLTGVRDDTCAVSLSPNHTNPIVALASFPGSGNTWMRHLLEMATGIYSGSIFSNNQLYKAGFIGELENPTLGTTLTVKTHGFRGEGYEAAILLLRDPYKALVAEFNREMAGQTAWASQSNFTGQEWYDFIEIKTPKWMRHALYWLNFTKPLHVVEYLNLKENTMEELSEVLDFLNVTLTSRRRQCVLSDMAGMFHRQGRDSIPADPFTATMHQALDENIGAVNERLGELNLPKVRREFNVEP